MKFLKLLSWLRNDSSFNRSTSFLSDILIFDHIAIPTTRLLALITFITPNMITVVSGLLGIGAAVCFFVQMHYVGCALMFLSLMLDCVDGNLARLTGRTSPFGAKLDRITDSLKKVLCLAALTYVSNWNVFVVLGLILTHYVILRAFPAQYPDEFKKSVYTERNLEPLFEPYDLLVLLLFIGPLLHFEIVLISIIVLQILVSCYSRTRAEFPKLVA